MNATYRASLLAFSSGTDLRPPCVTDRVRGPKTTEPDNSIKQRFIDELRGLSVGTLSAVRSNATKVVGLTLTDVQVTTALGTTGIDITVYALGEARVALIPAQRTTPTKLPGNTW